MFFDLFFRPRLASAPAPRASGYPLVPGPGWTPPTPAMRGELLRALQLSETSGAAVRMSPRDTSFEGSGDDDEEVINAVKSIPVHF